MNKKQLRKQILQLRNSLADEERKEKSRKITNYIINHPAFQSADHILLFASYKSEVDTTAIMDHALTLGKSVYMPKVEYHEKTGVDEMEFYRIFSPEDLYEGYKGIREPKSQEELRFAPVAGENTLVLMPGAVFDMKGNRIGYGGGFYDRFLEGLKNHMERIEETDEMGESTYICKIAVAFECQLIKKEHLEAEPHDVPVDYIVTEEGIYSVRSAFSH